METKPKTTAITTEDERRARPTQVIERGASAIVAELVDEDETRELRTLAVATRKNTIDSLSALENAQQIIDRMILAWDTLHRAAIRRTNPTDWVISKDRSGIETARLLDSGVHGVAQVYGLRIYNVRPLDDSGRPKPERSVDEKGRVTLRLSCDAESRLTGGRLEGVTARRRSDEEFTGRSVDASGALTTKPSERAGAFEEDLAECVYTRLRTKATIILADMASVPPQVLAEAWNGTWKKTASCRKGHGFGSGNERGAQSVAPEAVKLDATKLREALLACVGGDTEAASDLLVDITKGKDFAGFTSTARMTKDWQVENAWKRLREHPLFQGGAEPGTNE